MTFVIFTLGNALNSPTPQQSPDSSSQFLLARARAGDGEALGQLLEQYRGYLMVLANRYLDHRLRKRIDPADLVQTTFLEAQRDLHSFRGEQTPVFIVWLRNILHNNLSAAVARHIVTQKRSVMNEVSQANQSGSQADLAALLPGSITSPSSKAIKLETSAALVDALQKLPDQQAMAVQLRYFDGMNLAEISAAMGKSEMAVGGLLKRGLKRLREVLVDETL